MSDEIAALPLRFAWSFGSQWRKESIVEGQESGLMDEEGGWRYCNQETWLLK